MREKRANLELIFQSCLVQIQSGQGSIDSVLAQYPHLEAELRPVLEMALWLQAQKEGLAPRPAFVAASRQRLVSRIQQEQGATVGKWRSPSLAALLQPWLRLFSQSRFVYALLVSLLLLAIFLSLGSGVALAAQSAIPGDALYTVKTTLESAQLATSLSESRSAHLNILFAQRRLSEIQILVIENRYEYLHSTTERFQTHVDKALRLLQVIGERDSRRARLLGTQLRQTLWEQSSMYPLLSQVVPTPFKAEIEHLQTLTLNRLTTTEAFLTSLEAQPTPTLAVSITAQVVFPPTPTATLSPTATGLTVTTLPPSTLTPRPWMTLTLTPTPLPGDFGFVPTPTPTSSPTLEPPPTDKPKPTRKPTHTPKPSPNPTRRPPKPTDKP
jgi:hypothetical protein